MVASRILTLQRQLRTLGRIRTGWSEPYTKDGRELRRPVRSKTLVLTSPQEDLIRTAATLWGGPVDRWQPQGAGAQVWRVVTEAEAIEAILPPAQPLSQFYELWSGGGCALRCDGVTEVKGAPRPCVCLAKFGEAWYERSAKEVCRPTSRLNVFLDLGDFGVWRADSHGYYAAVELAGTVDMIKGAIGEGPAVPIRVRIDQRVNVEGGQTTPYPVLVVELRGGVASQILAGIAPPLAVAGAPAGMVMERPAIGGAPASAPAPAPTALTAAPPPAPAPQSAPDGAGRALPADEAGWGAWVDGASSSEELGAIWRTARGAGLTDEIAGRLKTRMTNRAAVLAAEEKALDEAERQATQPPPQPQPQPPYAVGDTVTVGGVEFVKHSDDPFGTDGDVISMDDVAEAEPDRNQVWSRILTLAHAHGWTTLPEVTDAFTTTMGTPPAQADGWTMAQFEQHLQQQEQGVPA